MERRNFRSGMMLFSKNVVPQAAFEFEAEVVVLNNSTTIRPNYQAVIHSGIIRQSAKVVAMD